MIAKKLLFAVWSAAVVYASGIFLFGTAGVATTHALEAEQKRLSDNLEELRGINRSLHGELEAVRDDGDTIAMYAGELGYAEKETRAVRISGLVPAVRRNYMAGSIALARAGGGVDELSLRIVALGAGLFVFLIELLASRNRKRYRRDSLGVGYGEGAPQGPRTEGAALGA